MTNPFMQAYIDEARAADIRTRRNNKKPTVEEYIDAEYVDVSATGDVKLIENKPVIEGQ